jgi:putative FmdB family regulatory protein
MPVYLYECSKCNHKFELLQSFRAEPSAPCPECHNGSKRLFVPVPIIFKGSGFYVTDSRKNHNEVTEKTTGSNNVETKVNDIDKKETKVNDIDKKEQKVNIDKKEEKQPENK